MTAKNFVKEAAATGQRIRGVHLTFAAPSVIEVLAAADLQFIYLDGEHGCFDWRDVEATCITAERRNLTPIARIPDASNSTITRFLDRGMRGLVVPHVESLDDAKSAIDAAVSRRWQPIVRRRPPGVRPAHRQPARLRRPATPRARCA
jgi:4-hydroxy-2-oxoheptanedioate aldolase